MQIKLVLAVLCCMAFSGLLHAEYDEAALKSLFTDKGQRARIDAARSGNASGTEEKQTTKVKVSGYVTRSDGKGVVWVNNKNTLDSSKIDDVKVYQSNIGANKKVTISVDGKTARLKPGEIWSKDTGKIKDNY